MELCLPSNHQSLCDKLNVNAQSLFMSSDISTIYQVLMADAQIGLLKILTPLGIKRESSGLYLLSYYSQENAVKTYYVSDTAVLMELLEGPRLIEYWERDNHLAAVDIAIDLVQRLHCEQIDCPQLSPLSNFLTKAIHWNVNELTIQNRLIANFAKSVTNEMVLNIAKDYPLHGDIHPRNIMNRNGQWIVIDPIGLLGPKAFDYANLFLNPWDYPKIVRSKNYAKEITEKIHMKTGHNKAVVLGWAIANALYYAQARHEKGLGITHPIQVIVLISVEN